MSSIKKKSFNHLKNMLATALSGCDFDDCFDGVEPGGGEADTDFAGVSLIARFTRNAGVADGLYVGYQQAVKCVLSVVGITFHILLVA